ncbi:MAG: 23S rRNA (uracil(1939)-C(5))-methyltransferase RlmD [Liquorilactobacillus nagelii]|uniref:23S rRNA (Uracil-5-)-methyltransferase RumA n=1 Tax=Liquorilactobacillus nagelii TaxID=82688 RepID=A0A3S6QWE7_9LACO|nr:23S rRNA (uracil(1939)-C(5))-methyltransferase RlmD [Liquorilactobacillus nagelii]AUJ32511.1 23S rRNA (uracil-5-)-methyltransferase RumA [Liquorilactobacillus nagelii]KRL42347.1 23S rRNA (uracil-5-)-methyltransferase RumA [Liquorilactobacillus nagelii DSM 13675]MCC7617121.1 23S rRNA (uracil(1939)-C(5))-methyltransferase RlmD [Liquorilactobacillus nagelii]MCP9316051.1 23S rRNA (uracil(1939)-C(5))-methyltransferase RlmD [Liquorilactobacillus nagelii]QYH53376.1 23S rRNA (uracil(1939)-C(5))-met
MNNFKQKKISSVQLEEGQKIPLTIKRLGINGEGIGYFKHKIVFVTGALPNEVVVAKVTKVLPKYATAEIHRIRRTSSDRVSPRDVYQVGGIELEHLAYPQQLNFKRDLVKQALEKYRPQGFKKYQILSTVGMKNPYFYRNKAQFQVREKGGKIIAGLYRRGTHEVIDLPDFSTQGLLTMKVVRQVCHLIEKLGIPAYNEKNNSGIIKTLIVRESFSTRQVQLTIVTNSAKLIHQTALIQEIHQTLPEVVSIFQNVNPGRQSLVWGEKTKILFGQEKITEQLGTKKYNLSVRAFFQLNPQQTAKMYQIVADALALKPTDHLLDAYCGVGTIGIFLADQVNSVRGMDTIPEAINDAKENASINNCSNTEYVCGTAEDVLPLWLHQGFHPDAAIVDPPRVGLDQRLLEALLQSKPQRLVYISCNPSTLARDLVKLARIYQINYLLPVDMFPQTPRAEVVVKLTLK